MRPISTIAVAVDFSDHSEAAVDTAIELAKRLGAEVHAIHSFDLRVPMISAYEVAIPEPYIEQSREAAAAKLGRVVEKIRDAGVKVGSQLVGHPPASAIVDAADRVGADLIVLGTRGNTGLKHLLLGSVAEQTLRSAHCAVMTVKPAD
jgi:nucleotide-binding universal stress UspA family protein